MIRRSLGLSPVGPQKMLEYAHTTPADDSMIHGIVRTMLFRRVFPMHALADHINVAAETEPIIYVCNTTYKGKKAARYGTSAALSIKKARSWKPPRLKSII